MMISGKILRTIGNVLIIVTFATTSNQKTLSSREVTRIGHHEWSACTL